MSTVSLDSLGTRRVLPIGDATATSAAAIIYTELAQGNPLYNAIAKARRRLHQKKPDEWHLLRLYGDTTPLAPVVTAPATEGRERLFLRKAEAAVLDAGQGNVCPAAEFVGRRRLLQGGLRCLRAPPGQAEYAGKLYLTVSQEVQLILFWPLLTPIMSF